MQSTRHNSAPTHPVGDDDDDDDDDASRPQRRLGLRRYGSAPPRVDLPAYWQALASEQLLRELAADAEAAAALLRKKKSRTRRQRRKAGLALLLLLALVLVLPPCWTWVWVASTPACHREGNPEHLAPCATFLDLNRALSGIAQDYTAADDFFENATPRIFNPIAGFLYDINNAHREESYAIAHQEGILPSTNWTLQSFIAPLPPLSEIIRHLVGLAPSPEFEAEQQKTQHDQAIWAHEVLFKAATDMKHIPDDYLAEMANAENSARSHLNQVATKLSAIDTRVQALSQLPSPASLAELTALRELSIRLRLAQVALTCFLTAQPPITASIRSAYNEIDPDSLHLTFAQLESWNEATMAAFTTNFPTAALRKCAKDFAHKVLDHCMPVDGAFELQGCRTHPDRVWWEWHNALPMHLVQPSSSSSSSQDAYEREKWERDWTRYVPGLVRRTAKYENVSTRGPTGLAISFREGVTMWPGVLRPSVREET